MLLSSLCEISSRSLNSKQYKTILSEKINVKNASSFIHDFGGDYDAIREHLEKGGGRGGDFSMSTMLRKFSQSSFGDTGRTLYKRLLQGLVKEGPPRAETPTAKKVASKALRQFGMTELLRARQFWVQRGATESEAELLGTETVALAYRAQRVVRPGVLDYPPVGGVGTLSTNHEGRQQRMVRQCAELVEVLTNVLACSPREGIKMAFAFPEVLEVDVQQVTRMVLWLRSSLPTADIARMVQENPALLVLTFEEQVQGMETLKLLRESLEGAPVDGMLQEDPWLMFEDLSDALVQLRELWPSSIVSPEAFSQSEPAELVLAIRALSPQGVPRRM